MFLHERVVPFYRIELVEGVKKGRGDKGKGGRDDPRIDTNVREKGKGSTNFTNLREINERHEKCESAAGGIQMVRRGEGNLIVKNTMQKMRNENNHT